MPRRHCDREIHAPPILGIGSHQGFLRKAEHANHSRHGAEYRIRIRTGDGKRGIELDALDGPRKQRGCRRCCMRCDPGCLRSGGHPRRGDDRRGHQGQCAGHLFGRPSRHMERGLAVLPHRTRSHRRHEQYLEGTPEFHLGALRDPCAGRGGGRDDEYPELLLGKARLRAGCA